MLEGGVIEVAQHGVLVRGLHGEIVVRARPELMLSRVTADAGDAPDMGRRGGEYRRLGRGCGTAPATPSNDDEKADGQKGNRQDADGGPDHGTTRATRL